MRNFVRISLLAAVILGLGACMGEDGQPYLALTWDVSPPDYFYTNALPPGWLTYGVYYPVDEGWWYAEYRYGVGTLYGIDFLITANEGEFLKDGEDSHFELYMDPAGWVYWQWDSVAGGSPAGGGEKTASESAVKSADQPIDKSGYEWKPLGSFEQIRGRYKMTGTYGIWQTK